MSIRIKLRKNVYDDKVVPLVHSKMDPNKVLGGHIAPVPYCNVFLCAETGSGKTSALSTLLEKCAGNAMVVVFSPSAASDDSWVEMKKKFEKRGNPFVMFSSIEEFVSDEDDEIEEEDEGKGFPIPFVPPPPKDKKEKKKEKKAKPSKPVKVDRLKELLTHFLENPLKDHPKHNGKICPRLIVIMDDMSRSLKHPSVIEFLKNGRHAKAKFIVSSQGIHDLPPEALRQVRQWFVFKGLQEEKLKKIRDDSGMDLDAETVWKIYKHATKEPYSFMLVNKNGGDFEFRSNFGDIYEIEKDN